jgi:cell division protein FtsZ
MGDELRVTVVATGLGRVTTVKKPPLTILRTGTDNAPMTSAVSAPAAGGENEYKHLDTPAVWRSREHGGSRASLEDTGSEGRLEIPAFLRKQAD